MIFLVYLIKMNEGDAYDTFLLHCDDLSKFVPPLNEGGTNVGSVVQRFMGFASDARGSRIESQQGRLLRFNQFPFPQF